MEGGGVIYSRVIESWEIRIQMESHYQKTLLVGSCLPTFPFRKAILSMGGVKIKSICCNTTPIRLSIICSVC